jgi:hypothetical protein
LLHFPLEAHEPKVNKAALDENSARNPGALVRGSASPSSLRPTGQSDQPGPSGKSDQTGQAKARAPQNNGPFEKAFLALMNQEIANGKGHETVGFNPILISLPNKPFTATRTFTDQRQENGLQGFQEETLGDAEVEIEVHARDDVLGRPQGLGHHCEQAVPF